MTGKTRLIMLVTLVIGFAAGFLLRPVIIPAPVPAIVGDAPTAVQAQAEPRGTQYFAASLEEARQVVAGCRDGSVRGDECANADAAIVEAESKERFRRFRRD